MHTKLIHRSRKNLEASAEAARWTSELAKGLEAQARDVAESLRDRLYAEAAETAFRW